VVVGHLNFCVYCSTTPNGQKTETTQVSIGRGVDEENRPGLRSSHKDAETLLLATWTALGVPVLSEPSQAQKDELCRSNS
jgi:hypothetical protein